ncbi:hypothetical protein ACLRDC_00815 [Gluconacetobacter sacchari]|uniref:Uncharacterized protein n=2 Tax=Gluconacetobacter sacchari TaxID=92759 RepID=A0A7W4IB28_9PROT|nr:hypothetical protein [Gluconacetobacter sacchari]MBB2159606.1 hypothetical protein [Gluconacetobacter sacchari]GBQ30309.1 hypothetical protein AA12717_3465 [Gluconacetobacter sacchari DSM 12717]
MQASRTFFLCCLAACAAAAALMLLMPHYAGMAHTLIGFYTLAAMVTAARMALRA